HGLLRWALGRSAALCSLRSPRAAPLGLGSLRSPMLPSVATGCSAGPWVAPQPYAPFGRHGLLRWALGRSAALCSLRSPRAAPLGLGSLRSPMLPSVATACSP